MSNPTPKPGTVALTLRRIARGWSIASIGFVLLIFLGEVIFPHAEGPLRLRDLVLFVFFPIGTCAGMILGWRWEGLGEGVTIGSLLAFYAALRIMDGRCSRWTVLCTRGSARIVVPLLLDTGCCKDKGQHGVAIR